MSRPLGDTPQAPSGGAAPQGRGSGREGVREPLSEKLRRLADWRHSSRSEAAIAQAELEYHSEILARCLADEHEVLSMVEKEARLALTEPLAHNETVFAFGEARKVLAATEEALRDA